ncbi:MAG TPA: peptidoglycan DD-metalloendopeptidase family protein [Ignavibacteriaceae bacterium]|nr:peptidoglycan DD-metalloendopeptidase family protein [Ignavibacteriaceae bacterium]
MVRNFHYIIFFFLFTFNSFQQEDIDKKKSELQNLKDEISKLEKEINQQTKKEKESFNAVEKYNKQSFLLNKLISNLRTEEKKKQQEINLNQKSINEIEVEIELLQKNYSKYVTAIYKYGKMDELTAVFDSESFEQAALRIKYLQRFSDKRENDLKNFEKAKEELFTLKQQLKKEKDEKAILAAEKEKEESGLKSKLNEKKKVLKSIRNNKSELNKELRAKRNAEEQIKNLVARLVEEAERKKEEEKLLSVNKKEEQILTNEDPVTSTYDIDLSTTGFETFSSLKGKLKWPVTGGKVIRKFGENKNQKLNTVTLNYGVDIKASGDLSVKCVAGGVVSVIDYIPGYGSVIIVTHKGGYRTVYSHLSEIYINEGDKVKAGSLLARVGESIEGNILHFEIWNSRKNQNPEHWLAKR